MVRRIRTSPEYTDVYPINCSDADFLHLDVFSINHTINDE